MSRLRTFLICASVSLFATQSWAVDACNSAKFCAFCQRHHTQCATAGATPACQCNCLRTGKRPQIAVPGTTFDCNFDPDKPGVGQLLK